MFQVFFGLVWIEIEGKVGGKVEGKVKWEK